MIWTPERLALIDMIYKVWAVFIIPTLIIIMFFRDKRSILEIMGGMFGCIALNALSGFVAYGLFSTIETPAQLQVSLEIITNSFIFGLASSTVGFLLIRMWVRSWLHSIRKFRGVKS